MHIPLAILLFALPALAADWPQWRGHGGNGISPEGGLPQKWSPQEGIAWKTPIPGRGRSSPIVWGDRIFLTTDIEGEKVAGNAPPQHRINGEIFRHPDSLGADVKHTLAVLCLDRKTGRILWQKTAYEGIVFDERHKSGSYASPTPITDGRAVYAYFGAEGLYAFDFSGNLLWRFDPGKLMTVGMGPGTSPILAAGNLILQFDSSDDNSALIAVNPKNGKLVWSTPRKLNATWSTPIVFGPNGSQELITTANDAVVAYDPKTGKELWRGPGVKGNAIPSTVTGNGIAVVSAGYPDKYAYAFKAGTRGKPFWEYAKGTAYVPSPLFYGDYVYLVTDRGLLTCIEAATGKVIYEGKRPPAASTYAGSPVAYGNRILLTSEDGDTYTIQAGPEFAILATNSIGEPVLASPAISNGMIFIRGKQHLFAIAQ